MKIQNGTSLADYYVQTGTVKLQGVVMKIRENENIAEIELHGKVNIDTSQNLSDKILMACNKEIQEVVVDLSRVTYMDSVGIAALVECLKWSKKEEKSFFLKNASSNVIDSLSLAKLDNAFTIIATV